MPDHVKSNQVLPPEGCELVALGSQIMPSTALCAGLFQAGEQSPDEEDEVAKNVKLASHPKGAN
jgi:hypothetical protein